jgi:hypothetical protein
MISDSQGILTGSGNRMHVLHLEASDRERLLFHRYQVITTHRSHEHAMIRYSNGWRELSPALSLGLECLEKGTCLSARVTRGGLLFDGSMCLPLKKQKV